MIRVTAFSSVSLRLAAASGAAVLTLASAAFAQGAAAPAGGDGAGKTSPPPVSDADVRRLNEELVDIDLLRPLLPLSLTQKQVDAIVASLKETQQLRSDVKRQDAEATMALADDIARAREGALKGSLIPGTFDGKIAEAAKASAKRMADAQQKATKMLLTTLDQTLTDGQKESVFSWEKQMLNGGYRVPAEYKANPSKAPKEVVRALALVELIKYSLLPDRALPLLEQYKPADATASAGVGAAAPAANP